MDLKKYKKKYIVLRKKMTNIIKWNSMLLFIHENNKSKRIEIEIS